MNLKILFLVPYPESESPSQRFRFEQYLGLLRKNNITYTVHSFLDANDWKIFYSEGRYFKKLKVLFLGMIRRALIALKAAEYDYVFIHREATPIGPPVVEWFLANVIKSKIIYDFDDAIWLTDRQNESLFLRAVKWRPKVKSITKWSYKLSCGNLYLCDFAYKHNHNVFLNPTTIDTDNLHNPEFYRKNKKESEAKDIIIGWTGSHSTLVYLESLKEVLQQIESTHENISVMVIADKAPDLGLRRMIFRPWSKQTEISDLAEFDIGIMPLIQDPWTEGKCGFKALQYMAMEIPAVASPVGVNTTIIDHGIDGFLPNSSAEWKEILEKLIKDKKLRRSVGKEGREKVVRNYSVRSNTSNFLSLFT